ncbi:hypothetical protein ACHAPJ_009490 [Fusarium lateritium]
MPENRDAALLPGLTPWVPPGPGPWRSFHVRGDPWQVTHPGGFPFTKELWFKTKPLTSEIIRHITTVQLITESHLEVNTAKPVAGQWTWFELSIGTAEEEYARDSKGVAMVWQSHVNPNGDTNYAWRRGRIFPREHDILKCLKPGYVISVWMASFHKHTNLARDGYLLLGAGLGVQAHQNLDLPRPPRGNPAIHVYGQRRQECLMTPIDGPPSEMEATMINGGVDLVGRLLQNSDSTVECRLLEPNQAISECGGFHSVIELAKAEDKGKEKPDPSFQAVRQSRFVHRANGNDQNARADTKPTIIVWDDSGVNQAEIPDKTLKQEAPVLIYQMNKLPCEGKLWDKVRQNAGVTANQRSFPVVFVVVDMDELRGLGLYISRGISWEKTMEDFRTNIPAIIKKMTLPRNIHLLVRCGYEGVIWVLPKAPGPDTAVQFISHMVPDMAEGDLLHRYHDKMPGIDKAFIAGLVASLADQSQTSPQDLGRTQVGTAVDSAITWSHRFASAGFCKDSMGVVNYPEASKINNDQKPKPRVIYADSDTYKDEPWQLFTQLEKEQDNVAAITVMWGTNVIEGNVPTARYGDLITADRYEIEGYRSTAAVIHQYLRGKAKNPMSIAVFGQPGAGKSFGVKRVIEAALGDSGQKLSKGWKPIEANLSQFRDYSDLVGIFDKIRDMALEGDIPVVLFDEFDSKFKEQLGWLKYFLAPMQDGQYLQDGTIHVLKRAIFVFIGGTSHTFKEFCRKDEENEDDGDHWTEGDIQAKKPDFVSRLSAHIDVAGPNKRGHNKRTNGNNNGNDDNGKDNNKDKMFVMRRAILLRSMLERRLGMEGKHIYVDERLLMALLKHPEIPNGSRSLDLIIQMSRLSGCQRFEPSALPADGQLRMHLYLNQFKRDMGITPDEVASPPMDIVLLNRELRARQETNQNAVLVDGAE